MLLSEFLLPTRWQAKTSLVLRHLQSRAAESRKQLLFYSSTTVVAIWLSHSLPCYGDVLHPQCVPDLKPAETIKCGN